MGRENANARAPRNQAPRWGDHPNESWASTSEE